MQAYLLDSKKRELINEIIYFSDMEDELTTLMHSEFTITPEQEISYRVSCVVEEVAEGLPLQQALEDYSVSIEQYNKYKGEWEGLTS